MKDNVTEKRVKEDIKAMFAKKPEIPLNPCKTYPSKEELKQEFKFKRKQEVIRDPQI